MAVDTRAKRASAIAVLVPPLRVPIAPDSTIDQGDRQAIAATYSGILAGNTPPPASIWRPNMVIEPFNRVKAITPSDTVNFEFGTCSAIYVGGAGIVVAVLDDGTTGNFTAVAGSVLPVRAKRVNATTTSATLLLALYLI